MKEDPLEAAGIHILSCWSAGARLHQGPFQLSSCGDRILPLPTLLLLLNNLDS